jgi:hypothetical protein
MYSAGTYFERKHSTHEPAPQRTAYQLDVLAISPCNTQPITTEIVVVAPATLAVLRGGTKCGSFPTNPRGSASYVHYRSARKTWIALLGMILALTALSALVQRSYVNPGIVYLVGTLIVIAAIYWAMRQV